MSVQLTNKQEITINFLNLKGINIVVSLILGQRSLTFFCVSTSNDAFLKLAKKIQQAILDTFEIVLEIEVNIIK